MKRKILASALTCLFVIQSASIINAVSFKPEEKNRKQRCAINKGNPSQNPPADLAVKNTPQFVVFGFDDNRFSGLPGSGGNGGMRFVLDLFKGKKNPSGLGNSKTFDGSPIHFSMYTTSANIVTSLAAENPVYNKKVWHEALIAGNEIANHSHTHPSGLEYTESQWENEMVTWKSTVTKPFNSSESPLNPNEKFGIGLKNKSIKGFRTPNLEYNEATFKTLRKLGYAYDSSIEEGYQFEQDGTNFYWPYRLDWGSPGNQFTAPFVGLNPLPPQPGIWEIPGYTLIIPPDSECENYGVEPGLRDKFTDVTKYYMPDQGKLSGLDWSMFVLFKMNKKEAFATLKYTFDQHFKGNRTPMNLCMHSCIYSDKYMELPNITVQERQQVLTEFLDYVLSKEEVRVVSNAELLDWLRKPEGLKD
ncbi:MAG: hypothetical protein N2645_01170 [Clostridia bacterium]|nr:hypothetical protein [Clostridia bacterium]